MISETFLQSNYRMMKLKDVEGNLDTVVVDLTPLQKYVEDINTEEFINKGYIVSNWNRGIWIKTSLSDTQMYPLCLNCDISEIYDVIMNLDVLEN